MTLIAQLPSSTMQLSSSPSTLNEAQILDLMGPSDRHLVSRSKSP